MTNFNTQSYVVYIKEEGTLDPYFWAGRKAMLDAIVSSYGDVTPTNAFNPRGGIENDGSLVSEPSSPTTTLTLKAEQFAQARSKYVGTVFTYDKRGHINGADRDSPMSWVDIERLVGGYGTSRTTPAASSSSQEEALISVPITGRVTYDIYRTVMSAYSLSGLALPIIDAVVSDPVARGKVGSVYAVAGDILGIAAGSILYNDNNGSSGDWIVKTLTGILAMPQAIVGFGNFVGVLYVNTFVRSDTYGDSVSTVTPTAWVGETMTDVFGLDQTMLCAVGLLGFISKSNDGGREWTVSLEASAITAETLNGGGFLDSRVSYVYGANGTILLSKDNMESWYVPALTGMPVADVLSMTMISRNIFVFVTSAGEVWSSVDGGDTVQQQTPLEGVPVGAYTNATVLYDDSDTLVLSLANATTSYFFRNVYGGASGYWYAVDQGTDLGDVIHTGMTMLGANNIIVVGGPAAGLANVITSVKS